jgi:hypothetical protein
MISGAHGIQLWVENEQLKSLSAGKGRHPELIHKPPVQFR